MVFSFASLMLKRPVQQPLVDVSPQLSMVNSSSHLSNLCVHFLGRRITFMTTGAIVDTVSLACRQGRRITVANYNVHAFNLSMQLPWFYSFLQNSEIVHCDGSGILRGLRWLGVDLPKPYRVSYTELMPQLLNHCDQEARSVFLLGAKPAHLDQAVENLRAEYPKAQFTGHHGYFDLDDLAFNEQLIEQINALKPNILIVGMGMPLQENWVQRYRDRLHVNAILVGGAVIDRIAGVVSDCPLWLSNRGLEWVYRLVREPKRLASRYLLGNPAFLLHVALARFSPHSAPSDQNASLPSVCHSTVTPTDLLAKADLLQETTPSNRGRRFIGEALVDAGLVTSLQVDEALAEQRLTGVRLGTILASRGWISQQTVDFVAHQIRLCDQFQTDRRRFGEILVDAGCVTVADVDAALAQQRLTGQRLGAILVEQGLISQLTVEFLVERVIQAERLLIQP